MPSIGPMEVGIVLLIALLVFGPKRLPELARSLGSGLREFKQSVSVDAVTAVDPSPAVTVQTPERALGE
ncbi:MAG: twin-arginine translocase TatA/TatE family subunit [Thermoleophilaceae bacterium]|nr:twin-arginine translocase TatA/TatE family subunit [Thermoleophilaceae bacterium]